MLTNKYIEAEIIVNGVKLSPHQSMIIRACLCETYTNLSEMDSREDPTWAQMKDTYLRVIGEVVKIVLETSGSHPILEE
jgi:hypothetical protein